MKKIFGLVILLSMLACQKPLKCGIVTNKSYNPPHTWFGQLEPNKPPFLAYYGGSRSYSRPHYIPHHVSTLHYVPASWILDIRGITCDGDTVNRNMEVAVSFYNTYQIGDSVWFGCDK